MFNTTKQFLQRKDPQAAFSKFLVGMAAVVFLSVVVELVIRSVASWNAFLGLEGVVSYLSGPIFSDAWAFVPRAVRATAENFLHFALLSGAIGLMHGYWGLLKAPWYPARLMRPLVVLSFALFWTAGLVHHDVVISSAAGLTTYVILTCALSSIVFGLLEVLESVGDELEPFATAMLLAMFAIIVFLLGHRPLIGILVIAANTWSYFFYERFVRRIRSGVKQDAPV